MIGDDIGRDLATLYDEHEETANHEIGVSDMVGNYRHRYTILIKKFSPRRLKTKYIK